VGIHSAEPSSLNLRFSIQTGYRGGANAAPPVQYGSAYVRLGLQLPQVVLNLLWPFLGSKIAAPPHVLKPFYHNTLARWQGQAMLQTLTVPTLVIRGHHDQGLCAQ